MVTLWQPFLILAFKPRPKSRDKTGGETAFVLHLFRQDLHVEFGVLIWFTGSRVFSCPAAVICPYLDFISAVENSRFTNVPLEEKHAFS